MIPYAACASPGPRAHRRPWRVVSAQKGTSLTFRSDDSFSQESQSEEDTTSVLSTSEIRLLEAVKFVSRLPYSCAEQESRVVGRRSRQPVITEILDLGLLDDTYNGVTKMLLAKCNNWSFNTFNLDVSTGGRSLSYLLVHLFQEYGFVKEFQLDIVKVWHCFNLMEAAYHRHNPYHNSVHAADVTQAMHCFLQEHKFLSHLTPLEAMASVIAAVAHDLDHPGVTQAFLVATSNHLVKLYHNSSVLENHHWRTAISCLRESGIFNHLERDVWLNLQMQIRSLILATDITRQKEFLGKFKNYLTLDSLDMEDAEYRHFALQIALKCADLCNPCRPWSISQRWSYQVCQEFYRQGAYEKQLKLPLTPTFDCSRTKVAKIQADFFQFVVSPLFETWDHFLKTPLSGRLLENLQHNFTQWQSRITTQVSDDDIGEKQTPKIQVDSPTSSSPVELIDKDVKEEHLLSSTTEVFMKQHRSKSDSGLIPPLMSSKIHMETYSTEELHPSTTLLSLSSITNTVQLRQVYATTKVESHLICPTVFQTLDINASPLEIPCSSSLSCDDENCSNTLHENASNCSDNSSCVNGCDTPSVSESYPSFYVKNSKPRSNSLIADTCNQKLLPQMTQNRRASDYCVSLSDSFYVQKHELDGCVGEEFNQSPHDSSTKSKRTHSKESLCNGSKRVDIDSVPSSYSTEQKMQDSSLSGLDCDNGLTSWGWHISRSFSAERQTRPTYDFDLPLPTEGLLSSLNYTRQTGRRGSAPVTYSFSTDENTITLPNVEDRVFDGGQTAAIVEAGSSCRRWSIPSEISGAQGANASTSISEGHYSNKMFNRRSSFGLLEPLLTLTPVDSETTIRQTCSPVLKVFNPSCNIFSNNGIKDELTEFKENAFVASDSLLLSLSTSQASVHRRGSLPIDLYHTEEQDVSPRDSTEPSTRSSILHDRGRRTGSPGELLGVLIGPSGLRNTIQGLVNTQDVCVQASQDSFRRKSGGIDMLSGLWRSRTNDIAIGVGMANKINLRRQLLEAWTSWRKEQGKLETSVGTNANISTFGQQILYQQRRGSVPLNITLSLSSENEPERGGD